MVFCEYKSILILSKISAMLCLTRWNSPVSIRIRSTGNDQTISHHCHCRIVVQPEEVQ